MSDLAAAKTQAVEVLFEWHFGQEDEISLGQARGVVDALAAANLLAVRGEADNRNQVETMQLAKVLYEADNWGVPDAGEKWSDGRAYDHEYDQYERLAVAALKFAVRGVEEDTDTNDEDIRWAIRERLDASDRDLDYIIEALHERTTK